VKSLILIGSLLALASSASAQGVFVDKGQSGLIFEGGYATNEDVHGPVFGLGYTIAGLVDIGIGWASLSGDSLVQQYNKAQYLTLYPFRTPSSSSSTLVLAVHESYGIQNDKTLTLTDGYEFLSFGASATLGPRSNSRTSLMLSCGYFHTFWLTGSAGNSGAAQVSASLVSRFPSGSVAFTPSLAYGDGMFTFGVTLGFTELD
jgi:hypothetical protein